MKFKFQQGFSVSKVWVALSFISALLISGCNGHTDNGVNSDGTVEEAAATPQISVTLKRNGDNVNRIKVTESAQLGVILLDENNAPISNMPVDFAVELGTLSASSALTNDNGLAEVELLAVEGQLGAAYATVSATINETTYANTLAYEIVSADALDETTTVLIGYFDDAGDFIEGGIKTDLTDSNGDTIISAGATLGLSVSIVDSDYQPISSPATISFTSSCYEDGKATLDNAVTTINGQATATYQDINCAGAQGNEDTIIATVKVNSADLSASRIVELNAESLGSIEFISASPETIVLKGTGGQGKQETSTVTFLVKGQLGNPLSQQSVDFALSTNVGNLSLAATSGVTNSDGLVSAKVIAGTVPAVVRVSASITNENDVVIQTQSDNLSVNTGLPDQNSMTLSLSTINPEARNFTGVEVSVRAYLADSFNNPVPDGTTVNFTTEGGAIEPSCSTVAGTCQVTWTSQEPYPDDHRVTILATAEGHEYFVDVNGNNIYDDSSSVSTDDGPAANASITNINGILSGLDRISPLSGGFIDMPEAWRDDNENNLHDAGEVFIDSNNDNEFTTENGKFNGPQCAGDNCATSKYSTIRKARVLITSSSAAFYRLLDDSATVLKSNYDGAAVNGQINIARGDSAEFVLEMSDTQFQTLAEGTVISINSDVGTLAGGGTFTIDNTIGSSDPATPGTIKVNFTIINSLVTGDEPVSGALTFDATSPSQRETGDFIVINLL